MDMDPNISLIESYVEGELSAEDRNRFEARLKEDADFYAEFQLYKDAENLLGESASLLLKEKMQAMENQGGSIVQMAWFRYSTVAAIVLLLIASFFWFSNPSQLNNQELITEYFEVYPAGNLRGSSKMENVFNVGMTAYMDARYEDALLAFQEIGAEQNEFIEAQLYLGNSYLAVGKYAEATKPLSKVYESGDSRFSEAAAWYLLMGYVGSDQEEKFQELSDEILEMPRHAYREKVLLLQKKRKN